MTYCAKCDNNYEGTHDDCSVGIKARPTGSLSVYANEVWNEAIEAAANYIKFEISHEAQDSDWDIGYNYAKFQCEREIRKLKK